MSDNLNSQLSTFCRRYGIDSLYVFGSRGQDVAKKVRSGKHMADEVASDVDVGVLSRPGGKLDARDKVRLMADLEDLLGVGRVDLVVLPEAPAFLAVDIIRGELLYEADPDRTAEYELYVLRRAGDLAEYERERVEQILTGAAS